LPADSGWPICEHGEPLTFIAQFNFSDSKDITGELPGPLLLLFGDESEGLLDVRHVEWHPTTIPNPIQKQSVPENITTIAPCYGHRFRTNNFPLATPKFDQRYPKCRGLEVRSWYHLPQYQVTQIGRAPYFIQPGDHDLPGQILCTLSSVQPDQH